MLAYTIDSQGTKVVLHCSDGNTFVTDDWQEASAFLLEPCEFAVVWNIDIFVDILSTLLRESLQEQLKSGGRILIDDRLYYYQSGRLFGINHINFYGLNRYADKPVTDVNELLNLGNDVVKAYKRIGIEPTKLTSPVSVFAEKLESIPFSRAFDLSDDALSLIDATAKVMTREWRDIYKLGYWDKDEVTDYDCTAAYPSIVAELPDITNATFFSSPVMPDKYTWGELQGNLTIIKPVHPFFCESTGDYPMGDLGEQSITTDMLWLLNKYQIGTFEMKHGDFFLLPEKYVFPFKATMNRLYDIRTSGDKLVNKITKGISVGIWGKLAERYENGLGDNFNSIYARMVTSRCMVKVASFVYHNNMENDLISVLVDGVLATKRLSVSREKKFGQWRMNEPNPALVLSLLYQWIGDKRPAQMTYSELMPMIQSKPNSHVYGDVDLNLIEHPKKFQSVPRTGKELLGNKYNSLNND